MPLSCVAIADQVRNTCLRQQGELVACADEWWAAFDDCIAPKPVPPAEQVCLALPMHKNQFDLLSRDGVSSPPCWQQHRVHPLSWPSTEGKTLVVLGAAFGGVAAVWQGLDDRSSAPPVAIGEGGGSPTFTDIAMPASLLLSAIPFEVKAQQGTASRNLARTAIQVGAVTSAAGTAALIQQATNAALPEGESAGTLPSVELATVSAATFSFATTWTLAHDRRPGNHTWLFVAATAITAGAAASNLLEDDPQGVPDVLLGSALGVASGIVVPVLHQKPW